MRIWPQLCISLCYRSLPPEVVLWARLLLISSTFLGELFGFSFRPLRGAGAQRIQLVQFAKDAVVGRPTAGSACSAADIWILQIMDEATAQDYYTGEELEPAEEGLPEPSEAEPEEGLAAQVRALQEEIKRLKTQPVIQATPKAAPTKTKPLFEGSRASATLGDAEWAKLQQLAGPVPTRQPKTAAKAVPPAPPGPDNFLAEIEKDAMEATEVGPLMGGQAPSTSTPLEQILVAQMYQNQALLQKLVGRQPSDPLVAALSGGDSGSGSSTGVKGCVARETYLRTIQDLVGVAEAVKKNAMTELGMTPDREDSSIMRRYVERKMALADHRTLGYVATLAAEGWASAYETQNLQMMGFISKLLIFLEQTCLDRGKTQLAWLLTGCQDPAFNLHHSMRQHVSIKPFSSLSNPAWISANLAFLKDLDYLEGRMTSLGTSKKILL